MNNELQQEWWLFSPWIPDSRTRDWVYKLVREFHQLKKENIRLQGMIMDYKQEDEMRGK